MDNTFASCTFFKDLSHDLIEGFNRAGRATTPVTVGSARENIVREKLKLVLPGNIEIGTGFVIDSYGHTSKQTDIVIYEKNICPIFSIDNTPESTYYPCESVIAVGEIKSTLDSDDLKDAFSKIESVKRGQRYVEDSLLWRKYCNTFTTQGAEDERYDQQRKANDQIFGFIMCQSLGLTIDTFLAKCKEEFGKRDKSLLPNIIVSLNDGMAIYVNTIKKNCPLDAHDADSFYFIKNPEESFQFLLTRLHLLMATGRSSSILPFHRYVSTDDKISLNGPGIKI